MTDFSKQVIEEIGTRGVTPKPRWHFLVKRSVFWTLALLSTLIGGLAFAIGDYVFFDNEAAGAAGLLETPLEGFIRSIPFIWLVVFGLFAASAYLGLRHTKTGYRYRTAVALAVVIILSISAGLILNALDFGQAGHDYLMRNTTIYDPLIHSREDREK
jgi:hypothetical protein